MKIRHLIAFALLAALPAYAQTHTAALAWTAPTTNTDGSAITGTITYNVYQATQTGTTAPTLAKVQSGITGTTLTITAGLTPGTTQCFAVTAVVNAQESAQSAQSCAAIPFSTPNSPSQITIVIH